MTTTPTPDIIMECLDALGNKVVFIQNDVYIKSERAKEELLAIRAENKRLQEQHKKDEAWIEKAMVKYGITDM